MDKKTTVVRKPYATPEVKRWGSVADLTRNGLTNRSDDGKNGSVFPPGKGASN